MSGKPYARLRSKIQFRTRPTALAGPAGSLVRQPYSVSSPTIRFIGRPPLRSTGHSDLAAPYFAPASRSPPPYPSRNFSNRLEVLQKIPCLQSGATMLPNTVQRPISDPVRPTVFHSANPARPSPAPAQPPPPLLPSWK